MDDRHTSYKTLVANRETCAEVNEAIYRLRIHTQVAAHRAKLAQVKRVHVWKITVEAAVLGDRYGEQFSQFN